MAERQSPKAELVATLDAMERVLGSADPAGVRLAMVSGLLEHAQSLAVKVGAVARARKEKRNV